MIHAGRYEAKCVSVQYGAPENRPNEPDRLNLFMEIVSGEKKGNVVSAILYFTDDATQYSIPKLRATGFKGEDMSKLIKPGTEDKDGVGLPNWEAEQCDINVEYEDYQGRQILKVNILDGNGRFKFKTNVSDEGRRAFGARLNKLVEGTAKSVSPNAKKPAQQKQEQDLPDDERIPF